MQRKLTMVRVTSHMQSLIDMVVLGSGTGFLGKAPPMFVLGSKNIVCLTLIPKEETVVDLY